MTEARIRANRKYNEKTYDRFQISVPKGKRDEIMDAVKKSGLSRNAFIVAAIWEKIERDADAQPEDAP